MAAKRERMSQSPGAPAQPGARKQQPTAARRKAGDSPRAPATPRAAPTTRRATATRRAAASSPPAAAIPCVTTNVVVQAGDTAVAAATRQTIAAPHAAGAARRVTDTTCVATDMVSQAGAATGVMATGRAPAEGPVAPTPQTIATPQNARPPRATAAYLALAEPLAGAVAAQARQVGAAELARLRDTVAPLAAWPLPAVAEHAAALADLLERMARLRV